MRSQRSRIGPALTAECGSRRKIQPRCCKGRRASLLSQRHGVAPQGLRDHMLADFSEREPGQGYAQAMRQLTGECLCLDDVTGGKAVLAPAARLALKAGQAGQAKSFTPFADDLARRVESRSDPIVGQSLRCQEDALERMTSQYGASAPETAGPGARQVSGSHQMGFFLASEVRLL
jgi:hypothetical protein